MVERRKKNTDGIYFLLLLFLRRPTVLSLHAESPVYAFSSFFFRCSPGIPLFFVLKWKDDSSFLFCFFTIIGKSKGVASAWVRYQKVGGRRDPPKVRQGVGGRNPKLFTRHRDENRKGKKNEGGEGEGEEDNNNDDDDDDDEKVWSTGGRSVDVPDRRLAVVVRPHGSLSGHRPGKSTLLFCLLWSDQVWFREMRIVLVDWPTWSRRTSPIFDLFLSIYFKLVTIGPYSIEQKED